MMAMMEDQLPFDVSLLLPSQVSFSTQPVSHIARPRTSTPTKRERKCKPGPRHRHRTGTGTGTGTATGLLLNSKLFSWLILLTCCIAFSSAARAASYIDEQMVEARQVETLESTFERLARGGIILVDQSPPPVLARQWAADPVPEPETDELQPRDDLDSTSSAKALSTTLATSISSPSTLASSATSSIAAATTDSASPLPSPFDSGFSNNITSKCQSFMTSMLSNATFKTCLPFSLLLQNSLSFFQVEKSVVRITQTLDYSCAANVTSCADLMTSFASNITTTNACASDLSSQNPLIQQARSGLLAYKPLYTASCLRNPSTSAYCFADAITNASNPANSYIYFLPLNNSLVGGSQPTCSTCLKNTMAIFEAATADRSSALASDYVSAATQVNINCGPGFVNASLAAAITSSAPARATYPGSVGSFTLVLILASWFL